MDKQIRELILQYSGLLGFSKTGNFNVVSAIRGLDEGNVYFSGKKEVIDALLKAREDNDFDAFKEIFESNIEETGSSGIDIESIEKDKGMSLDEKSREGLEASISNIDASVANGSYTPEQGEAMRKAIIDQAFSLDPSAGTRLIEGEDGKLEVFGGYFEGVLHSNIFSQFASVPEIVQFQNYLIENNIATEEEFAGTKGVYSETLRQKIQMVMDYADANINATEGSAVRETILGQTPLFFADVQYQDMDISFERNLFNYAVQQIASQNIKLEELGLEEQLEQEALKYIPPKAETLETMVDAYFVANIGRSATDKELSEWATALADSYSESYSQLKSYQQAIQNFDLKETPVFKTTATVDPITERPITESEQIGTRTNLGELQQLQPLSPQEIFEAKFEKDLESEMESWQKGQQVKDMQNKIMSAMFGG